MTEQANLDLEIRHVDASKLAKLSAILDTAKAWDILLDAFSKPMPPAFYGNHRVEPLNLSLDDVDVIKQQVSCGKSPSLALLNHWSITGRRRPTVRTLIKYLRHYNLRWAEDHVIESILGIKPQQDSTSGHLTNGIERPEDRLPAILDRAPNQHPQHPTADLIDDEFKFEDLREIIDNLEGDLKRYSFTAILESTNRFCHRPYDPKTETGTRIGDGRFSSVFLAQSFLDSETESAQNKEIVAAKLLKSECNRKYLANEINLARKIRHENILELLGISLYEGPTSGNYECICLIYPYIQNGSLLSCLNSGLSCQDMKQLGWGQRVNIALKVARGVSYLHTFKDGPIIHRDIKTANILIDVDLEPKVGDFTLVRQLDSLRHTETQFSQNVIGTSVYMPPEAFRGDISTKFDTFSFGIVIFELLTGKRPFDDDEDKDLLTYISDKLSDILDNTISDDESLIDEAKSQFLAEILDKKAGEWDFSVAKNLFNLGLRATENRKKSRPELTDLLPSLETTMTGIILNKHKRNSPGKYDPPLNKVRFGETATKRVKLVEIKEEESNLSTDTEVEVDVDDLLFENKQKINEITNNEPSSSSAENEAPVNKKTCSDAINQTDIETKPKTCTRSVQTDESLLTRPLSMSDYEHHRNHSSHYAESVFKPMYSIPKRKGQEPPLKIGLTLPKGRKRKVFYPHIEEESENRTGQ